MVNFFGTLSELKGECAYISEVGSFHYTMPNKLKSKSRSKKDGPVSIPFHFVFASVATATQFALQPSVLGNRVSGQADSWSEFRVTKLKFRLHPMGSSGGVQAMCFVPGIPDTMPATYNAVTAPPDSVIMASAQTTPTSWMSVARSNLHGYNDWFKTIAGVPDPTTEIQGYLCLMCGVAGTQYAEIRGVIQFQGPIDTASTPMLRRAAAVAKEYARFKFLMTEGPLAEVTLSASTPKGT